MKPHMTPPPLPPELGDGLLAQPGLPRGEMEAVWRLAEAGRPMAPAPDPARVEALWATLEAATARDARRDRAPLRLVRGALRAPHWLAMAACVALLVAVGVALWLQPTTRVAPQGERLAVTLPDGSRVLLNSGSAVSYGRAFAGSRHVELTGEAFFDVVPSTSPFQVETFNSTTTVVGTQFNVRSWPEDPTPTTTVAVLSGKVHVTAEAGRASVSLEPGQTTQVVEQSAAPTPPMEVALEDALAWREGGLAFTNAPLGAVLNEIERRFGVEVTAPPALQARLVVYRQQQVAGAEQIVADLAATLGLQYRATDKGFALSP